MTPKRKKVIISIFVAVCVLLLAACGGGREPKPAPRPAVKLPSDDILRLRLVGKWRAEMPMKTSEDDVMTVSGVWMFQEGGGAVLTGTAFIYQKEEKARLTFGIKWIGRWALSRGVIFWEWRQQDITSLLIDSPSARAANEGKPALYKADEAVFSGNDYYAQRLPETFALTLESFDGDVMRAGAEFRRVL